MADTYTPPVYAGCDRPLTKEHVCAPTAHGQNGLSDVVYPEPVTPLCEGHAVNAIIDIIRQGDGDIELITLGPLTNIAMALRKAPDIAKKIPHITMMGGAGLSRPAHTVAAEYNIWVDPEAAHVVLTSGIKNTMLPLEACYGDTEITEQDIAILKAFDSARANFCVDTNAKLISMNEKRYGRANICLPDPTAVAVCAHPELIKESQVVKVSIDLYPSLGYGQTVCDGKCPEEQRLTTFVPKIDAQGFKELLFALVK